MSSHIARKSAQRAVPPFDGTVATAGYIGDMVKGLRELTGQSHQKDLAFLDFLLALAEQEACCLASNVYH